MRQTIEFVDLVTTKVPCVSADAFSLRKDRPAQWLQAVCFYILRRIGAYHAYETEAVTRHVIDKGTFTDRLLKQWHDVECSHHSHPSHVYMGSEDYAAIASERAVVTHPFSFNTEYGINGGREVYGLKVTVLPWMRGCLVIPSSIRHYGD
jgi:hypothetical protein